MALIECYIQRVLDHVEMRLFAQQRSCDNRQFDFHFCQTFRLANQQWNGWMQIHVKTVALQCQYRLY